MREQDEISDMPMNSIAIIGLAGRFPGAPDLATFWQNLLAGRDTLTRFAGRGAGGADESYVGARGVLDDVGLFDAEFFGIAPREAERMDPQHRLFLEACANALEDAGYVSQNYAGEIGLFGGCSLNTYLLANLCRDRAFLDELTENYQVGEFPVALGNDKDFLTTRAAYKLDLRGPVVSVQSACATSLVAICQASQALLNFTCDMALAGGVSVTFPQERGHLYQEGGLASSDGVCRPFDQAASGTVFGHGVGVVLLKRLEDALADRDTIHAVIRGFAVNNDGAGKAGYMAPGVGGQTRVIAAAQAMAGVSPESISYVEAHGTGTPLGDPIEVAALKRAFRMGTERTGFCRIGTAKGNIGHLDSAAGVAGVIKTVLSLEHRTLPGLAHFTAPNPNIDFAGTPFYASGENAPWTGDGPLRAGVSAFGVGGVNAHVVLEEAPQVHAQPSRRAAQVFCFSARTDSALRQTLANAAERFGQEPALDPADVAFTLACGRAAHARRFAIAAGTLTEAAQRLQTARVPDSAGPPPRPKMAFLFSGQGSQFPGMGRELYASEPVYRGIVDECCELAHAELGFDLRTLLFALDEDANASERLQQTANAQPALFITELALARQLVHWGIRPEAVCGHSLGEYAAATLAGIFPWQDALRLVCLRGRLMQAQPPGAMLSVRLDEAGAAGYCSDAVSLAALNSARASVLSGPSPAIDEVEARLTRDGVAHRRLRTSHAFHSAMMDPMLAEFEAALAKITLHAPQIPMASTATGHWLTADEAVSPAYWVRQCRLPVRFAQSIQTLLGQGLNTLLETGPGEALTTLALHARTPETSFTAIPAMRRPSTEDDSRAGLQNALASLWTAGVTPDWTVYFAGEPRRRVPLPTYPFERKLHWVEPPARTSVTREISPVAHPPMPEIPSMPPAPTLSRNTHLQALIAKVFTDLSGIETRPEEMESPFLELGFDSLFLTQATQSLQRTFGVKLTFRQLMEQCSTIASLAAHLDAVLPAERFQPAPLTPVAAGILAAMPARAVSTSSGMERLLADQLAALSEMFATQVATLRAAAGQASVTIPQPAMTPPAATRDAEVKHGSFRPLQAKVKHELDAAQERYVADLIARYTARTPGSKRMTDTARGHLADPRAVAGFRPQWKEMVYPLITERALGAKLWDVDGNEYIDIVNGYGCIMFGHSPAFVVEAARAQLELGVAIGPQTALAGEVAALICELTGNERVTFCNTGSEAVMAAIRVARTVTGRDRLVYFSGDYHGTFDEVLVRSTPRGSAPIAPGIPRENTANVTVLEYGAPESLAYLREHAHEIAAVLVEPVQTRNPGLQPAEFMRSVREMTAKTGSAMILDEVVTGFRLAPGGAQEFFGIRADMCTYGKVIGGGHPIGVLSGKAMYLDALDGGAWQYGDDSGPEVGVTFFAGTFVRHPLALAAARAVLHHLKAAGPELQRSLNARTARLAESLDAFFTERGVPSQVRHFASWFYFTFPSDARLAGLLYYAMRAKGIHIQEGYPCFLTTAHTDADLAAVERAFRETILEMQTAGAMPCQAPAAAAERTPALHGLASAETPARTPLTEPQREIFLAAALSEEANCAFNESLRLDLEGAVRRDDLAFALDAVVARHDALRSTVSEDGEDLCFAPAFSGQTEFLDLSAQPAETQERIVQERIAQEGRTPFDLHGGPLLRTVCFTMSPRQMVLLLNAHHIVLDGWSASQVLEEVGKVYSRGAAALTHLAPLMPFSSYAARESAREKSGEFADNERFWVERFNGRSPRLNLPTDRPRPPQKSYRGDTLEGSLGPALTQELKRLSARSGCTLYVALLSSFELLLHRLTQADEVVVGISTAGQALLEGASLVGHCVHFLPMLSTLREGESALEHMQAARSALLDAYDHQEFTYGSLLGKLTLEREPGRLPLIEVQFNLEKVGTNVRFDGLASRIRANPKQFVNTDLFLNVVETADDLVYACDFNTGLFDRATVARWMAEWAQLLAGEAADAMTPVSELSMLPADERALVLSTWNQTARDFGPFEPMHATFLRLASAHPERMAIVCGAQTWSYAELAEYATLLARRLLREGLRPGHLVGICIERSPEMAGAMLAVMMAGGAYVPLDPRHPSERLALVMADAGIVLLLTGRDPSVQTSAKILKITGPQPGGTEVLPGVTAPDSLAYVIYTSGSTGVPKGVAIEHRSLTNLLRSMQREPGLSADDVLVAVTTLAFDIAGLELLLPLMTGARLVIATDEQANDGALLLRAIDENKATVLQATPGLWRILLDAGWQRPLKVLCGGEALTPDLAGKLLDVTPDVWNVYGPTETTIWSSASRVTRAGGPLRIGPPIANTTFYVLDGCRQPLPIGVLGELYIGGEGLARGYWNRPELTAEKFLPSPFGPGKLYRTGDLARRHADGTVELQGRADFQVKVRGYRIELGDVEAALMRHEAVREAVVVQQRTGDTGPDRLVAFVAVAHPADAELVPALDQQLLRLLPEYMVPALIQPVAALPRTPNGKVDRRALPLVSAAGDSRVRSAVRQFCAPATPAEQQLAGIWAEVLGLKAVSTTDSIFELGADSLLIFRIAARAQREGLPLRAADIFAHRTIAELCRTLEPTPVGTKGSDPRPAGPKILAASRERYRRPSATGERTS